MAKLKKKKIHVSQPGGILLLGRPEQRDSELKACPSDLVR